jgi:hypothetical protein
MAPIGHKHINLRVRGILKFDFAQHAPGLLRQAPIVSNDHASK